jgi:hexosaminidase
MAPALRLPATPLLLLLLLAAAVGPCPGAGRGGGNGRVDLWPMPASVARGAQTLHVSRDLKLTTAGSNYTDGRGILRDAVARMVAVVEMDHVVNGSYHGAPVLAGVNVVVRSPEDKVCGYAQ